MKKVTEIKEEEFQQTLSMKQFVGPIIIITLFIVLVGGISFAYFGFNSVSTNNTSYLNAAFPERTNKSVDIQKSDCAISVSMSDMTSTNASNTTPKYTQNCSVNVTINGSAGDTCTYNVSLSNGTEAYAKSVTLATGTFEYSGTLSGAATKAETNMDDLVGTIAANQTITVTTANTAVTKQYKLTTKFYNLAGVDQKGLLSASNAKTYRHFLEIKDLNCDMNH